MTTKTPGMALACLAVLSTAVPAAGPRYEKRWFYASHNLLVDKNADGLIALIRRAGKAGYNGVVLADYKLNILGRMPKGYFKPVSCCRTTPGRPRSPTGRWSTAARCPAACRTWASTTSTATAG